MSITYDTSIFCIEPEIVPELFSSRDELSKLWVTAYQRIEQDPADSFFIHSKQPKETLNFAQGSTRNGWAVYTVAEVLEPMVFPALKFLTDSGYQYVFEEEYSLTKVMVFRDLVQKQVISEMHQFFEALMNEPELLTLAAGGVGSDDEFLESLQKDYVSRKPWLDINVKYNGEDGDNEDYLCVYLRSILAVLENADKQNFSTIYILKHPN